MRHRWAVSEISRMIINFNFLTTPKATLLLQLHFLMCSVTYAIKPVFTVVISLSDSKVFICIDFCTFSYITSYSISFGPTPLSRIRFTRCILWALRPLVIEAFYSSLLNRRISSVSSEKRIWQWGISYFWDIHSVPFCSSEENFSSFKISCGWVRTSPSDLLNELPPCLVFLVMQLCQGGFCHQIGRIHCQESLFIDISHREITAFQLVGSKTAG